MGVTVYHVHDIGRDSHLVPRDVRLVAGEFRVPHQEEQAYVCRENVKMGVGQRGRGGGTGGDQTDRRHGGFEDGYDVRWIFEGDVHEKTESESFSHSADSVERFNSNGCRASSRLSVVYFRRGRL